jgi:hypothetical protein
MLTYSIVLLRNNADPHTAACIRALREHLSWHLSDNPLYSLDLAPRNYYLFTYLKNWVKSQCFNN